MEDTCVCPLFGASNLLGFLVIDEVDATVPTATNTPTLMAMMGLVMAQLKPLLDGFNRSLEHLNQQVRELASDVGQLKRSQLGAEQQAGPLEESERDEGVEERLDGKLDVVFQQIGEVQRQMEIQRTNVQNRLQSQHATLLYNLTAFKMDVDMKLKHHQKIMQVRYPLLTLSSLSYSSRM